MDSLKKQKLDDHMRSVYSAEPSDFTAMQNAGFYIAMYLAPKCIYLVMIDPNFRCEINRNIESFDVPDFTSRQLEV